MLYVHMAVSRLYWLLSINEGRLRRKRLPLSCPIKINKLYIYIYIYIWINYYTSIRARTLRLVGCAVTISDGGGGEWDPWNVYPFIAFFPAIFLHFQRSCRGIPRPLLICNPRKNKPNSNAASGARPPAALTDVPWCRGKSTSGSITKQVKHLQNKACRALGTEKARTNIKT